VQSKADARVDLVSEKASVCAQQSSASSAASEEERAIDCPAMNLMSECVTFQKLRRIESWVDHMKLRCGTFGYF
jgi:hypothetical protein